MVQTVLDRRGVEDCPVCRMYTAEIQRVRERLELCNKMYAESGKDPRVTPVLNETYNHLVDLQVDRYTHRDSAHARRAIGPAGIRRMWETIGRLRRERDEARSEIARLQGRLHVHWNEQDRLAAERDEARHWARRMKRERDRAINEGRELASGHNDAIRQREHWHFRQMAAEALAGRLAYERDAWQHSCQYAQKLLGEMVGERDEARHWARRMKRERDTARALYDGLSERVHELDDATGDWRLENEKLQRALAQTIAQREAVKDALNLSEKESYHILQATKQLRRAMLGIGLGLGRFEEMMGEPLVVIEEATRFISSVVPKMEEE